MWLAPNSVNFVSNSSDALQKNLYLVEPIPKIENCFPLMAAAHVESLLRIWVKNGKAVFGQSPIKNVQLSITKKGVALMSSGLMTAASITLTLTPANYKNLAT